MLIEGGTFLMGSPVTELERDGDEVLHSVTVSDFYMAAMGVTQREYAAAQAQIRQRGYADKNRSDGRPITIVGITFSSAERNITDWKAEGNGWIVE